MEQNTKTPGLFAIIEAILFAAAEPVSVDTLAKTLQVSEAAVTDVLVELRGEMDGNSRRGVTLREVAGGWQMATKSELYEYVAMAQRRRNIRLSRPTLETLAIVAYRQPITRMEIEALRGVKVEKVLATLLEQNLIAEVGRKEALGRPILYGTTQEFLVRFGLNGLGDLPPVLDLPSQE
jgi:segregation and condensation protein B